MKQLLLLACAFSISVTQAQFWTQKATSFTTPSRGVDNISIVNDNVIWAKAYDGVPNGSQTVKEYTRSTDGGNTWVSGTMSLGFQTSGLGISSITAVSENTAWISAYPATGNVGGIWKTTNGGAAWTKQATATFNGAASFANFVYFWDENNGVCQGDPESGYFEIYTTSNGGTTWTRVPQANIPAPIDPTEYGYVHNYDVVGNTIWFGTNFGRIFKSTDMGINWTASQSPISDFAGLASAGNYSFSDQMKGILNNSIGQLWNTNDGGVTWNPMAPSGVFGNNDIEYVPGTSIIVSSAGAAPYGSYYSLDDGMTWNVAEAGTQFTIIEFLNTTTGFAGSFTTNATEGGIFKYTGNQLATPGFDASRFGVFPNPSNGIMQIAGAEVSAVAVSDMLGKVVYSSKFSGVDQAVNLDLSFLNSGLYMMNVTSAAGTSKTIKVIIR